MHVSQALQHVGVGIRRRLVQDIGENRIRFDSVAAYKRDGTSKYVLVDGITTDHGEQRKLLQ